MHFSQQYATRNIRILVIDDNSPFVLPLVRSFCGYRNIQIDILLSSTGRPLQFRYSRVISRIKQVDHLDDDNINEIIQETASLFNTDILVPTREWISVLLAKHKKELELFVKLHPIPEAGTLEITSDKWKLNQWLRHNGFPYAMVSDTNQTWTGSYPVLIKPLIGIGGSGIQVLHTPESLKSLLGESNKYEEEFFLQEFIEGYDIDMSFLAIDGKIIYYTQQRGLISKETEYSKGIEFVKNEELLELVSRIISKLDYTGIAHLDFRFSSRLNQYILIDFNARYWSTVLGSVAKGVNFPYLAVTWSFSNLVEDLEFETGYYYLFTAALKAKIRNIFSNSRYSVRFRDTQLRFIKKDPLPDIMFHLKKIFRPFKKRRGN